MCAFKYSSVTSIDAKRTRSLYPKIALREVDFVSHGTKTFPVKNLIFTVTKLKFCHFAKDINLRWKGEGDASHESILLHMSDSYIISGNKDGIASESKQVLYLSDSLATLVLNKGIILSL